MLRTRVGEAFVVDLPAGPSTGFRWEGPEAESGVRVLWEERVVPDGAPPGAANVQRFHLTASAPGRTTLTFTLKRSWEATGVESRDVEVDVEP